MTPRHRRRLAQLFPIWEVRNGSRAKELNHPASIYIDTHGGTGIGGTDDHAGVDIGRTFTETPRVATTQEFLAQVRAGRAQARGAQGSAAKWAHAAMALAFRALGRPDLEGDAPNPAVVLKMIERVMSEGDVRKGEASHELGPDDARAILRAWLAAVELELPDGDLVAFMQSDGFSHSDLFRRARRIHERKLAGAVARAVAETEPDGGQDYLGAAAGLFNACVPAIPYAPATAFLGREKSKLVQRDHEPIRVALVADAVGGMHGVTHTLDEIRERGVPGFEVEVIGTDANVDRRLPAVAEVDIPYYAGLKVGVPSLPGVVEALAEGRYSAVHLVSPGPAGIAAALIARIMELPILGSYHTELAAYAGLRANAQLELGMQMALGAFYGQAAHVLSPSAVSDEALHSLGIPAERIGRWDRGVDVDRFDPAKRDPELFDCSRINVLYVGRQTKEKGVDLLAEAFELARLRDPRLHLVLAGGGPEEQRLRARLGEQATFLGWQEGEELARTFASADLFLFASQTDTFGQVILEAQASGLPVVAVGAGGPTELISDGRTGVLCPPDAEALAAAVAGLAHSRAARKRLARGGLAAVRERTWDRALGRLADGYLRALGGDTVEAGVLRAA